MVGHTNHLTISIVRRDGGSVCVCVAQAAACDCLYLRKHEMIQSVQCFQIYTCSVQMISEKPFADITSNAPSVQSTLCAAESNKNNLEQMFLTNVVLAGSQFQAE